MPGTSTVHGEIHYLGMIHEGTAINTKVIPYASPTEWFFKQFASQYEFEQFVAENGLIIVHPNKEN